MTPASVSFRISRNTEDLAETIHALSQRLVKLEQRLAVIDRLVARREESDPSELESLDNVERLLRDCRDLLDAGDGSEPAAEESELLATDLGSEPLTGGDEETHQSEAGFARAA